MGIPIDDPQVARYLLDLRHELERKRDEEAAKEAAEHLAALAPPDISGA
jgi:hypothetical protein